MKSKDSQKLRINENSASGALFSINSQFSQRMITSVSGDDDDDEVEAGHRYDIESKRIGTGLKQVEIFSS